MTRIRKGKFGHRHREKDSMQHQRQIMKLCSCKPRKAMDWRPSPKARRWQGRTLPRDSERTWPFWHLGFRLPVFRTARVNLCSRKPPHSRYSATRAWGGSQHSGLMRLGSGSGNVHCKTSLTCKARSLRSFLTGSNTALSPLPLVL